MPFDPDTHHRRSIRLRGWDYADAGAYFVTICTQGRKCLFGDIVEGEMRLNEYGNLARDVWAGLPAHYPQLDLDVFVTMPNHVHGILILTAILDGDRSVGAGLERCEASSPAPAPSPAGKRHGLPEIVRAFKAFSAREINTRRMTPGMQVWQRNYYERVIRNERELGAIREYIALNPVQWLEDDNHPDRLPPAPA